MSNPFFGITQTMASGVEPGKVVVRLCLALGPLIMHAVRVNGRGAQEKLGIYRLGIKPGTAWLT